MAYTLGNKCAKIVVNGQFEFNVEDVVTFLEQCKCKTITKN